MHDERKENEANAKSDVTEDTPSNPLPMEGLPELTELEVEDKPKRSGNGMERALEQLEEYDEGVPPHNPNVQHHEE